MWRIVIWKAVKDFTQWYSKTSEWSMHYAIMAKAAGILSATIVKAAAVAVYNDGDNDQTDAHIHPYAIDNKIRETWDTINLYFI